MHLIKTILIIIFITTLAIVVEAVTFSSINKLEKIHHTFKQQSKNYKNYNKEITLTEIIYDEKTTKGLMKLIISDEE